MVKALRDDFRDGRVKNDEMTSRLKDLEHKLADQEKRLAAIEDEPERTLDREIKQTSLKVWKTIAVASGGGGAGWAVFEAVHRLTSG